MKNLHLFPDTHRQQRIIKAVFAFDKELVALIKTQQGARWSQSLQSWYIPAKDFQLNRFFQSFKGKAFIDYSPLKIASFTTPLPRKVPKESTPKIQLPKGFKEQLILRHIQTLLGYYSSKTTEMYTHVIKKSLANIKSPLDSIIENQKSGNEQITKIKIYKGNKRNNADIQKLPIIPKNEKRAYYKSSNSLFSRC